MFYLDYSLLISGFSLLISAIVAFRTFYFSRPILKVMQTDNAARSFFIKSYDGSQASLSYDIEDDDPSIASALLIEIILINKSSLPLSILEFQLTGEQLPSFQAFTSYSPSPSSFKITTRENSRTTIDHVNYLQPEFTLEPYSAKRGYILFWTGIETSLETTDPLNLKIVTSRKEFSFKVKYSGSIESIKKHGNISKDKDGNKVLELH
ncbi:hypothetical protein [Enterococcus casseliflavus]|uniref:hypothetical protein n=1 Tax=Enterococcus casseliflavus TaxID=37734 RepID=UPI001F51B725|nr:hypothetical protein [Enterococcus casseliflavus]WBY92098.1 hypothetical protein PEZ80_15960 [Enterococcus casseliflavus]